MLLIFFFAVFTFLYVRLSVHPSVCLSFHALYAKIFGTNKLSNLYFSFVWVWLHTSFVHYHHHCYCYNYQCYFQYPALYLNSTTHPFSSHTPLYLGDALLYAIREGVYRIVELLIDQPSIPRDMLGADWSKNKQIGDESFDYSPDISPSEF